MPEAFRSQAMTRAGILPFAIILFMGYIWIDVKKIINIT